jgi:hypothetical protein
MNFGASFAKVKLTNDSFYSTPTAGSVNYAQSLSTNSNCHPQHKDAYLIPLSTFKKYRIIVLIQRVTSSMAVLESSYIPLKETSFIAVTHYQNEKVNTLKKLNNPHAKGFVHKMVSEWRQGKKELVGYWKRGEFERILQNSGTDGLLQEQFHKDDSVVPLLTDGRGDGCFGDASDGERALNITDEWQMKRPVRKAARKAKRVIHYDDSEDDVITDD